MYRSKYGLNTPPIALEVTYPIAEARLFILTALNTEPIFKQLNISTIFFNFANHTRPKQTCTYGKI